MNSNFREIDIKDLPRDVRREIKKIGEVMMSDDINKANVSNMEDIYLRDDTFDEDELVDNKYRMGFTQWISNDDNFYPSKATTPKLPPGTYNIEYDNRNDMYYLKYVKLLTEELLRLPNDDMDVIIEDLEKFWNNKEVYDRYGYVYQRGILLWGAGGNGKTCLIQLLSDILRKKYGGIVLNIRYDNDVFSIDRIMMAIREIEPDKKIIAIIEDIDKYTHDQQQETMSRLLSIMDGQLKMDNLVLLATTNKPELLEDRLISRPSRIARRVHIKRPDAKCRKFYIENKITKEDLEAIDIDKWVKDTENFTLDHLKELVRSVFVHGYTFEDAHSTILSMIDVSDLKSEKTTSKKSLGFN